MTIRLCRLLVSLWMLSLNFFGMRGFADPLPQSGTTKRPVTVADSIGMRSFADPDYESGLSPRGRVARFSPDGQRFSVILRKGNLERNTNDYSLLIFRTDDAMRSLFPEITITFSSSSNRAAIQRASWVDNDTVFFLGEHPGERQQLYSLTCSNKKVERLTNHPTNLLAYSASTQSDQIAFVAQESVETFFTEKALREGIAVSTEDLSDLIAGRKEAVESWQGQVFFGRRGSKAFVPVKTESMVSSSSNQMSLSPDGKYLLVMTMVVETPEQWSEYEDRDFQMVLQRPHPKGTASDVLRFLLIDTESGKSQPLINAPSGMYGSEIAWSPDSRSVVVAGTFLPLNVTEEVERKARQKGTFVVEVQIPSGNITKITQRDLRLVHWNHATDEVLFQEGRLCERNCKPLVYRKKTKNWEEVTGSGELSSSRIEVVLEEDMNTSPRVSVKHQKAGDTLSSMDLNPEFASLTFGRVNEVRWKCKDGHEGVGGLYYPPDFVRGRKYPLIIQTHGFTPDRFWIDGPFPTASAAQVFASRGFLVLQVGTKDIQEDLKFVDTPQEAPREVAGYEGAIDLLDSLGILDRARVGIIGFSRTCFEVKYALTHSAYHFAAATVSDGADAGYFQYLAWGNSPGLTFEFEALNGGAPFGEGLTSWLRLSPSFSLDQVNTPLRIEALGRASLLLGWEWFAGLSRLGKPVDLIYLPEAVHLVEKPWERMASQEGNVDWFSFWLKGDEDPNPAKADQYARWHQLRGKDTNPRPAH